MTDTKTAPDITVDRGQPVIVIVTFGDGDPDLEVDFAFTRPGSERPYVDDGYGQPKSKIERLGEGVYRYTFSTAGFMTGDAHWHFSGKWKHVTKQRPYDEASIFGQYHVNKAPEQI